MTSEPRKSIPWTGTGHKPPTQGCRVDNTRISVDGPDDSNCWRIKFRSVPIDALLASDVDRQMPHREFTFTPCQDPSPVNSAQLTQYEQKKTSLRFAGNFGPLAHNEFVADRGQALHPRRFPAGRVSVVPLDLSISTPVLRGIYR